MIDRKSKSMQQNKTSNYEVVADDGGDEDVLSFFTVSTDSFGTVDIN